MATFDAEYIKELEEYLKEPSTEPKKQEVLLVIESDTPIEKRIFSKQYLLYLVVDKSLSMRRNGIEDVVKKELEDVRNVIEMSEEYRFGEFQTAITIFGSTLDMHLFRYGLFSDISYEANETSTRLYDAVIESCKRMEAQYDRLEENYAVRGTMLIFTDGEENSSQHTLQDLRKALRNLHWNDEKNFKRNIRFIVAAFKNVDLIQLGIDFNTEPIIIDNCKKLIRILCLYQ